MSGNVEIKLDSGAQLYVTIAPFEDCKALHDAVIKSYMRAGATDIDPDNVDMKSFILHACSDKEVERCLFKCAERALYSHDGSELSRVKVSKDLFDDPEVGEKARKDYYSIAFKLVEVNLAPFTQALFSVLSALSRKNTGTPASK